MVVDWSYFNDTFHTVMYLRAGWIMLPSWTVPKTYWEYTDRTTNFWQHSYLSDQTWNSGRNAKVTYTNDSKWRIYNAGTLRVTADVGPAGQGYGVLQEGRASGTTSDLRGVIRDAMYQDEGYGLWYYDQNNNVINSGPYDLRYLGYPDDFYIFSWSFPH